MHMVRSQELDAEELMEMRADMEELAVSLVGRYGGHLEEEELRQSRQARSSAELDTDSENSFDPRVISLKVATPQS